MKKLPEIFTFETLAPIFVILFHVNNMSIPNLYFAYDSYVFLFLTSRLVSFIVPGFIFASGLKLSGKYYDDNVKLRYFPFMRNRILKIYIPYILWVVIYYFYYVSLRFRTFGSRPAGVEQVSAEDTSQSKYLYPNSSNIFLRTSIVARLQLIEPPGKR